MPTASEQTSTRKTAKKKSGAPSNVRSLHVPPRLSALTRRAVVDSSLHSDTHEPVPLPFRLSAFVPTNLVIVTGMLLPNPSLASIIGWQWANQTLNVCVNYFNANKSVPMSNTEVAVAYTTATATSVGLAVGLNRLVPKLKSLSPGAKALAGRLVPFVAVASAGCVNVGAMRWKELRDGVDVFPPAKEDSDDKPESLGKSPTAGRYAVGQTAASRVLTNACVPAQPSLFFSS